MDELSRHLDRVRQGGDGGVIEHGGQRAEDVPQPHVQVVVRRENRSEADVERHRARCQGEHPGDVAAARVRSRCGRRAQYPVAEPAHGGSRGHGVGESGLDFDGLGPGGEAEGRRGRRGGDIEAGAAQRSGQPVAVGGDGAGARGVVEQLRDRQGPKILICLRRQVVVGPVGPGQELEEIGRLGTQHARQRRRRPV